jgi:hypothetical protein
MHVMNNFTLTYLGPDAAPCVLQCARISVWPQFEALCCRLQPVYVPLHKAVYTPEHYNPPTQTLPIKLNQA